jgi:hypothetical protein
LTRGQEKKGQLLKPGNIKRKKLLKVTLWESYALLSKLTGNRQKIGEMKLKNDKKHSKKDENRKNNTRKFWKNPGQKC